MALPAVFTWIARTFMSGGARAAGGASGAAARGATTQRMSLNEKLWALDSLSSLRKRVIDGNAPEWQHQISVAVRGGPKADMKRIWRLALSTAFGRYRAAVPTYQAQQIESTWDITDKTVGVKIAYAVSGAIANVAVGQGSKALEYLYNGPSQETVGGSWPDWLRTPGNVAGIGAGGLVQGLVPGLLVVGGIVRFAAGAANGGAARAAAAATQNKDGLVPADVPILEDNGRLITTAYKLDPRVQPPAPDMDYLIALVSNALTKPCYLPSSPPPQPGTGKERELGFRLFAATENIYQQETVNKKLAMVSGISAAAARALRTTTFLAEAAVAGVASVFGKKRKISRDFYPLPPEGTVPSITGVTNDAK